MLTVLTRKAESLKTLSIPTVTIQPTAAVTPPPEPVDETYREMISQIFQRARNREEMSAGVHEAFLAGPIYATKGVTTQPAATVSIQPPAVVVTVIQPVPAASPAPEPIHAVALPKPIVPEPLAPYVEAFSKNTAVTGAVDTEDLTSESTLEDGTALGWKISKTEGRTDSVSWSTTQQVGFLSANTKRMLEMSRHLEIKSGAGLVFGRIPQGFAVEISDPSAHAWILPSEVQESYQNFVFINVKPGSQLIYLTGFGKTAVAPVGAPVLAGKATYLDLQRSP